MQLRQLNTPKEAFSLFKKKLFHFPKKAIDQILNNNN